MKASDRVRRIGLRCARREMAGSALPPRTGLPTNAVTGLPGSVHHIVTGHHAMKRRSRDCAPNQDPQGSRRHRHVSLQGPNHACKARSTGPSPKAPSCRGLERTAPDSVRPWQIVWSSGVGARILAIREEIQAASHPEIPIAAPACRHKTSSRSRTNSRSTSKFRAMQEIMATDPRERMTEWR